MQRKPDWHMALCQYLAEAGRAPFAHGTHDCALFAAGAVAAMTGEDPAARWRGKYKSLKGGLGAMRRAGVADHVAMAARVLAEIPPAMARPGDIAVIPDGDLPALGVVQGEWIYVLAPGGGLALVELTRAARAFRVGE